ncbi:MAG TPA: 4-hydroxy-3-methylbut-2-enyl diphosphate reductase, partial [Rhodospirillaceae bacterium]|nr:4-hydroxy-3-methylbut-2-enyl diphosphate reductase [Rhodospirillaceae bacterium]
ICYATTNRQAAVRALAAEVEAVLVIGAPNSSNSRRLVEVARVAGCPKAALVQRATDIDWDWMQGVSRLGISAGASAPEVLVEEVINACRDHYAVTVSQITIAQEDVEFKLPRILAQ